MMTDRIKKINEVLQDRGEDFSVSPSSSLTIFSAYKDVLSNIDSIPWKKLVDVGWVKDKDDYVALAGYISSPGLRSDFTSALFRKNESVDQFLIDLWLKKVDQSAGRKVFETNIPAFEPGSITKTFLSSFVQLSREPSNLPNVVSALAEMGVVLIICPGPQGIKTDGVVYLTPDSRPIIGLTLRYPRLDYFWFTLLHELSHISLHFDKLHSPIVDDLDVKSKDILEVQANRLAKDSIVPRYLWERCEPRFNPSVDNVLAFSSTLDIHPALVAGLLQFEFDRYDLLREIVDEVNVRSYF